MDVNESENKLEINENSATTENIEKQNLEDKVNPIESTKINNDIKDNENETKSMNINDNKENASINNNTSDISSNENKNINSTTTTETTTTTTVPKEAVDVSENKTPEDKSNLVTRKSSTKSQLSKEERIKRQREARKKKILASSHERLSRITKTYSQGSIHSESSVTSTENTIMENKPFECKHEEKKDENLDKTNELQNQNNENKTSNDTQVNSNDKEGLANEKTEKVDSNEKPKMDKSNNISDKDVAKLVFQEILKEEFKNTNSPANPNMNPLNNLNINGINNLPNMENVLNNPFNMINNILGLNNDSDDNISIEDQKEANLKYKKYCKLCKLIHTVLILMFGFVFFIINILRDSFINGGEILNTNGESLTGIHSAVYKMSILDTPLFGGSKKILGMSPWSCFIIFEITLLAIQMGYQYTSESFKDYNIRIKNFDLTSIPIVNKVVNLYNQYKLFIELLINDVCLYLFLIGISISFGKLFY